MAALQLKRIRRGGRFLPGVVLTLAAVVMQLGPLGQSSGIESRLHDLFFWQVRPAESVSPEITVIEVDDGALETIGRWPWAWRDVGGMVRSLGELDARVVALDITYGNEPDPITPEDSVAGQAIVAEDQVPPLAAALAVPRRSVLTYSVSRSQRVEHSLYNKLVDTLTERPQQSRTELADALAVPQAEVEQYYVTALRRALEIRLARMCDLGLTASQAREQLAALVLSADQQNDNDMRRLLLKMAAAWAEKRQALMQTATLPLKELPASPLETVDRPDPPLVPLLRSVTGSGFANVRPDADGTIRRVPLLLRAEPDALLPQFGLEIAMQSLGWDGYQVSWPDARTLRLSDVRGKLHIDVPLDDRGCMVINWSGGRQRSQIRRLSIQKLREHSLLSAYRRHYSECMDRLGCHWVEPGNQRRLLIALAPLMQLAHPLMGEAARQQLLVCEERLAMEAVTLAEYDRPAEISEAAFEQFSQDAAFLREDYAKHGQRKMERLRRLEVELEPYIRDRICLIGLTATSLTLDLKPTPVDPMLPGVYAHAHIIDNLLRGSFVREPAAWQLAAVTAMVGLLVTLLAGGLAPLRSVLAGLAVLVVYYGLSLGLFHHGGLLMPLAGPWTAGLGSVLGVLTWRELTEGRQRRWITNVFKQYTSDQLVDVLVEDPAALVLGGQRREMTVYFSDIAGFTGISERLDPPTLVAFLQTYLEVATDRLLEQGGTLDKYQGDGIVAFFGAPLPMADHAACCLRAAQAHLRALPELNRRLREMGLLPANLDLRVRIGVSTGSMIVGNIGSSRRFEYTVIGDAVNVGARIEGANRFFGTTVLVSEETRRQALESAGAEAFLLRRIGPVCFVGKEEPVTIYQLLDGQAEHAQRGLAAYDAAVAMFEEGRDREAHEAFTAVLDERPADGPTLAYLRRIAQRLAAGDKTLPGPWKMEEK